MKVYDLTHIIEESMPVYPGTDSPRLFPACTIEKDGFKETLITMVTHTGTHIDCPKHLFQSGESTDNKDISSFFGKGCVLDFSFLKEEAVITKKLLLDAENTINTADFIILHTGWARFWNFPKYFGNFPVLDNQAAQYLSQFNLKGIGLDTISLDPVNHELTNHKIVLSKNICIIENLNNTDKLIGKEFLFTCLPLKIRNGDGSPVRAAGIVL